MVWYSICYSSVPPGVGFVHKGLRGALILEIACTFDPFTEQTFLKNWWSLYTSGLGLMFDFGRLTHVSKLAGCQEDVCRSEAGGKLQLHLGCRWVVCVAQEVPPSVSINVQPWNEWMLCCYMNSLAQIEYPRSLPDPPLQASSLSAVNPNMCPHTAGLTADKVKGLVNLWVGDTWVCEFAWWIGERGGGVKDYLTQCRQFMACERS